MNQLTTRVSSASVALIATFVAAASVAGDGTAANADREAIHAAAKQYLAAVQRGDNESLRKMWTAEGDYVDVSGKMVKAKDLFSERVENESTDTPPSEVGAWESSLRFITPDVVIEDGVIGLGLESDGSAITQRFSVVWVKRDGRWLIDCLREAASKSPSINDRLRQLSWLIGEWAASTDNSEVIVSTRWSDQGTYLLRDFVVRGEGREPLSGTERIGWDPATKKIKSWTFDSQGGAGGGYWRRDGDRWIVDAVEVMPDGKQAETSIVYTPTGPGRFLWEVASGRVAEETLPKQRIAFTRADE